MLAADETMCRETKGALTYVFRMATKEKNQISTDDLDRQYSFMLVLINYCLLALRIFWST